MQASQPAAAAVAPPPLVPPPILPPPPTGAPTGAAATAGGYAAPAPAGYGAPTGIDYQQQQYMAQQMPGKEALTLVMEVVVVCQPADECYCRTATV